MLLYILIWENDNLIRFTIFLKSFICIHFKKDIRTVQVSDAANGSFVIMFMLICPCISLHLFHRVYEKIYAQGLNWKSKSDKCRHRTQVPEIDNPMRHLLSYIYVNSQIKFLKSLFHFLERAVRVCSFLWLYISLLNNLLYSLGQEAFCLFVNYM